MPHRLAFQIFPSWPRRRPSTTTSKKVIWRFGYIRPAPDEGECVLPAPRHADGRRHPVNDPHPSCLMFGWIPACAGMTVVGAIARGTTALPAGSTEESRQCQAKEPTATDAISCRASDGRAAARTAASRAGVAASGTWLQTSSRGSAACPGRSRRAKRGCPRV